MTPIAFSGNYFYPDVERAVYGHKTLVYAELDMLNWVLEQDYLPIVLPIADESMLRRILRQTGGLLLTGGSDLSPESYGESPIGEWRGDPRRDTIEKLVIKLAIEEGLPILGVCRGFQSLNMYFGGTLYQDIKTQKPEALVHRDAITYDRLHHDIAIVPNTPISTIYEDSPPVITVNSIHHQGIKDLAPELKVAATSIPDGIIEAVYHENYPEQFIVGVQWHPEFSHTLGDKVVSAPPLLNAFLTRVQARRKQCKS